MDLVADVLVEQFHHSALRVPPYAASARARDAQGAALGEVYATPVATPREGDVALMAPLGWRGVGHHIGVACSIGEHTHILHCCVRRGTCLHLPRALPALGLDLRGWYRWRRHEET